MKSANFSYDTRRATNLTSLNSHENELSLGGEEYSDCPVNNTIFTSEARQGFKENGENEELGMTAREAEQHPENLNINENHHQDENLQNFTNNENQLQNSNNNENHPQNESHHDDTTDVEFLEEVQIFDWMEENEDIENKIKFIINKNPVSEIYPLDDKDDII